MFTESFVKEAKALFPGWTGLHEAIDHGDSQIVMRYLDDNREPGIHYTEVLSATSLDELKAKAMIIKRKRDLYHSMSSGECYQDEDERRKNFGCPRCYAQSTNDSEALKAFPCCVVFYFPSCEHYNTGECWAKFDALGLKTIHI